MSSAANGEARRHHASMKEGHFERVDDDGGKEAKWSLIGPGIVVAGTGVGAADMVATLIGGSRYGYMLLWAVIVGVVMKIILVEGAGRYSLATGYTVFEGWRKLGKWTTWYFAPYIVIWGFVYGASAMSSTALPLAALFPQVPLNAWAVGTGIVGFLLVWFNKYAIVEKVTAALVGIMFVTIVALAVIAVPNIPEMLNGLIPRLPSEEGGIMYTLALAGGVGGTITLAAYGYWLREKGWYTPKWMKVMRIDNTMAYVMTGIFVVSMLIVGAEVVRAGGIKLSTTDAGLLDLEKVLEARYGVFIGKFFLVGFFAAAFSSVIGVWNGVSLMFADFMAKMKGLPDDHPDGRNGGKYFKWYVLWLTFPPMLLLFIQRPFGLIVAYGVLGALFMPFMAITNLGLLNRRKLIPDEWRNNPVQNIALGITALLFVVLGVYQVIRAF
ncbi:Nramp family divalent metal transporter [Nigerium massiliense]|uniref:Nramp family divalent metal transporter n=1 Tax=Nigerium massiliense TaxID=1522317 RepID=UPI000AFCA96B|nr:Nramp family divalent metal transporter [Nigerium massiliense]